MGATFAREHAAFARLRSLARKWGGEDVCEIGGDPPALWWLFGTTMIAACTAPDGASILRAFLVLDPEDRANLEAHLAPYEASVPAGGLVVDEEGDVEMILRVPAETETEQLDDLIRDFCRSADRLDDVLRDRLGGLRSVDKFQHDVLEALGGDAPSAQTAV